ncbi:hypothetical protein BaRGS_00003640 [Batillaria attramentaria]|uniref:Uncharacterized protein n=1 Tax=Batillaria attramentaria TaxID=370345 RepID=A0ABD0LZP0_9CAEN
MLPNGIASLLTVLATVGCHAKVKRSDDVAPLETVVQQQAAAIQSLQTKLSALEQSFGDKYMALNARLSLMEQHGGRLLAMTGGYWDMGESAGTHRDTSHGTVHLAGGEQVWVQHNSHGSTILQYWYTTFTGVLLQADLD